MKIVLEGCDGVGKTSVAKLLAEHYKYDLVHFTGHDPTDNDFYAQTLRKENVVYDRHYIGELVYPRVFNRIGKVSFHDIKWAFDNNPDAYFFILTAPTHIIQQRLEVRGNENQTVLDNLNYINSKFITLAKELDVPLVNTSVATPEEIAAYIIKFIEEKEKQNNGKETL